MKINIFSILAFFCVITLIGISGSGAFGQTKAGGITEPSLVLVKDAKGNWVKRSGVTTSISSKAVWPEQGLIADSEKAVDGDSAKGALNDVAETLWNDRNGWFQIDLGGYYKIDKIIIHPRDSGCPTCLDQFKSTYVIVSDRDLGAKAMTDAAEIAASSTFWTLHEPAIKSEVTITTNGSIGKNVRLQLKDGGIISLAEIEIVGVPPTITDYKPAVATAAVFDPNYPSFRGEVDGGYRNTLQGSPKIVGVKNSDNTFDLAFQDNFVTGKGTDGKPIFSNKIYVNTYGKAGDEFKKTASMYVEGLGAFGGFAKDAKDRYIFTTERWNDYTQPVTAKVFKNTAEFWEAKYFDAGNNRIENNVKALMNAGTSRLAVAGNSLLITTNIYPAHPYQVILDTADKSKNTNRAFFESQFQHNFGQRVLFDGKDFVVMENRDHDVSVTLSKLSSNEVLPLAKENKDHALEYVKRIFSVYSHTNFGNNTYIELGNVEKGLDDDKGYLVLFASERDWNSKLTGYEADNGSAKGKLAPTILSPRDIGLVHVKKDFNIKDPAKDPKTLSEVNWLDKNGNKTQCPLTVDTTKFVNSSGETKTVTYEAKNDGWDWNNYNCPNGAAKCDCRDAIKAGQDKRTLVTKGVKWITTFGDKNKKAAPNEEFTSVNHPKLVRISTNKYIALWEEWTADYTIYKDQNGVEWQAGRPEKIYKTTKAATITLVNKGGEVEIRTDSTKDLGNVRLMPGDDAFEFEGKAAWAVGDITKGALMFYTVDGSLNLASYKLEL